MEKDLAQRIHRQASRLYVKGCLRLARASLWQQEKRPAFLAALHQAVQEKHIDLSDPNPVAGIEWEALVPGAEWEALGDTGEGTIKVTVEWRVSIAPLPEASDALSLLPS